MAYTGPTIIQHNHQTVASSLSDSWAATVTAGDRMVVIATQSSTGAGSISTITDTQGNTYTQHVYLKGNSRLVEYWSSEMSSSGSNTITVTWSQSASFATHYIELEPCDANTTGSFENGASSTHYSAASGDIDTSANALLLATDVPTAAVSSFAADTGSGFAMLSSAVSPSPYVYAIQYKESEAGETDERCAFTLGTARAGVAAAIAFVSAAGPSTYDETGSGGTTAGSTATPQVTYNVTMNQGSSANGSGDTQAVYNLTASGGMTAGGVASLVSTFDETAVSGGAETSGDATSIVIYNQDTSGGIESSGYADEKLSDVIEVSGGAETSGDATSIVIYNQDTSGGIESSGYADEKLSDVIEVGGGVELGGTSTFDLIYNPEIAGGSQAGGLAVENLDGQTESSGGIETAGDGTTVVTYNLEVTDGSQANGEAEPEFTYLPESSGGVGIGGESTFDLTYNSVTSGGSEIGGSSTLRKSISEVASGGINSDFSSTIQDNSDAEFETVGTWVEVDKNTSYKGSFLYSVAGSGENTATWTLEGLETDIEYFVSVSYREWVNRATDATFQIHDNESLLESVEVDQTTIGDSVQYDGVYFLTIGRYHFTSGTCKIILNNDANGLVVADGVRLEKATEVAEVSQTSSPSTNGSAEIGGSGAFSYNEISSGGSQTGGSADEELSDAIETSGGIEIAGDATQTFTYNLESSGGIKIAGSGLESADGVFASGTSHYGLSFSIESNSGLELAGESQANLIYEASVDGGTESGGLAEPALTYVPEVLGGSTSGGEATVSFVEGIISAGAELSGQAAIGKVFDETANGGIMVAGHGALIFEDETEGGTIASGGFFTFKFDEDSDGGLKVSGKSDVGNKSGCEKVYKCREDEEDIEFCTKMIAVNAFGSRVFTKHRGRVLTPTKGQRRGALAFVPQTTSCQKGKIRIEKEDKNSFRKTYI